MTTEYTPTAAEVDEYFAIRRERAVEGWYAPEAQDRARKEWDLMLAAHDARVRAEALREAVNYFETWVDVQELDEQTSLDGIHWVQVEEAWTLQGIFMEWFRNRADRIEQEAGA